MILAAVFRRFGGLPKAVGGGGVVAWLDASTAGVSEGGAVLISEVELRDGLGSLGFVLRRDDDNGLCGSGCRTSLSFTCTSSKFLRKRFFCASSSVSSAARAAGSGLTLL